MLASLHTPTLGLATATVQFTLTVVMLIFLHSRKTYPGFGRWAASQALWLTGFVLLLSRGIATDFASVIVSNYLLICGMAIFYEGLAAFTGKRLHPLRRGFVHLLGVVCISYMAWHTYMVPNVNMRVTAINLYRVYFSILCLSLVLADGKVEGFCKTRKLLTFVFVLSFAASGVRVYWALTSAPVDQLMVDDLAFRAYLLLDLFFLIAMAFSVLVLTSARVEEELDQALQKADQASRTDALTGVWNRMHFESAGRVEAERARRYGTPLSILILDIDHFKRINDGFGHATGDRVIRKVAEQTLAVLRATDLLFRWGGEEFVVLLPLDGIAAVEVANKIRQQIECTQFEAVSAVTVSIGVTELSQEELLDDALRRADVLLYCAKQEGRNRVEAVGTKIQTSSIQQLDKYGQRSASLRGLTS